MTFSRKKRYVMLYNMLKKMEGGRNYSLQTNICSHRALGKAGVKLEAM